MKTQVMRWRIDALTGLRFTLAMRLKLLTVLCAALLGGCQTSTSSSKTKTVPRPAVVPVSPIRGKVVLLNAELKYIVVDFSLGRTPREEQMLNVYRAGQKVGEVRISRQSVTVNFAADLIVGEAKVGDEVKED